MAKIKWSAEAEYKNIFNILTSADVADADCSVYGKKWFTFEVFDIDEEGNKREFANYFALQRIKAYLETKSLKKYEVAGTTYYEFEHCRVRAYTTSWYF